MTGLCVIGNILFMIHGRPSWIKMCSLHTWLFIPHPVDKGHLLTSLIDYKLFTYLQMKVGQEGLVYLVHVYRARCGVNCFYISNLLT